MPKDVHPNGDDLQQQKCSAFEAARGQPISPNLLRCRALEVQGVRLRALRLVSLANLAAA